AWACRIDKEADRFGSGDQFTQQLQPLSTELVGQKAHSSHISTWVAETGHETKLDRIATAREYNRYRGCCRLGGHHRLRAVGKYHTYVATDQRPPTSVAFHSPPPPSGTRSPNFGLRHNRIPTSRGGTRLREIARARPSRR